jgi:DNA-binding NtrC family response regulator
MAAAALFGHSRGAFTGATTAKKGLFRDAHRGVLFLDEIGDLDPANQALLLRAIETRSVQPVGETQTIPFDTQLILATHHDLPADVQNGKFRADLWHRISAFIVRLTPLREKDRYTDIRPLLTHFIAQEERAAQKRTAGLQPEALRALLRYAWPGNVRELYNVATRLVTHAGYGLPITLADIRLHCPEVVDGPQAPDAALHSGTFAEAKEEAVRMVLYRGLESHNGDVREAAEAFGLRTHHLVDLLRRYGLMAKRDGVEATVAD